MAPLVVIRGGSKYVEYRETRAEWMRLQHLKLHESARGRSSSSYSSDDSDNGNNSNNTASDLNTSFARATISMSDAQSASHGDVENASDSESDDDHERLHPQRSSRFGFSSRGRSGTAGRSGAAARRGSNNNSNIETMSDWEHGVTAARSARTSAAPPDAALGRSLDLFEHDGMRGFHCADCGNLVADRDDIVAKTFFGRTGKAFLMNNMFNITTGSPRSRYLMTGMHTIADVSCSVCACVLGWKYIKAMETAQKYKEGKFIVEKALVQDADEEHAWQRY